MNGVVHTSACYRLSRTQNFTDFDFRGTTTTKTTTTTMTMTTTTIEGTTRGPRGPKNACLLTHRGTCWPEQHGKLHNLAHFSHYSNTTHAIMHQEYKEQLKIVQILQTTDYFAK